MTDAEYHHLLTTTAIHQFSEKIFQDTLDGKTHFHLSLDKLEEVAKLTLDITQKNYPEGKIPLHSRWRHFEINQENRAQFLNCLPQPARVQAQLDLAFISVLLDAGAGGSWQYRDRNGEIFSRSEGLAVASLELFAAGLFSSTKDPYRVDAPGLQKLSLEKLQSALQINEKNTLAGLEGRWQLLQNLSKQLLQDATFFSETRPSGFYYFLKQNYGQRITASELLTVLLLHLNSIWPTRNIQGYALGDIWQYPRLGWAPFHKLTLWLTLSLIEPLQGAGFSVIQLEELPGLAEYRNGGLFIDGQVLTVNEITALQQAYFPGDEIIIEWRALTLALLNKLSAIIRKKLGKSERALPLVNILQGGAWQAGRQLAFQRSATGEPPLRIYSTGTVI